MTKLLIVDDNEQNLYMLQVLLEGHGYKIVLAEDGAEALETARRDPPDMIIADILMPVMDGFTLCRQWKQDDRLKGIPFVFYTATYTDPKDEEFALGLGAERYIAKPTEPDVFVGLLQEVIAEHEAGRLVVTPGASLTEEPEIMREYSERLVKKLEDKMLQLEETNQALERNITERVRAEEALRLRANELAALHQTVLDITTPHELPALLQAIVERAVELLNGTGGEMYLCDPEQREARCVVSYNTPSDYTGTVLKYGEGAAGTIAMTGEPLIIDDYRTWQGRAAAYDEEQPFSAVISAPMIWQDQVIGVIPVLHDTEARKFNQTDLELLTLFANHAAIAVENARLYEDIQRHADELEARVAERTAELKGRVEEVEHLNQALTNLLGDLQNANRLTAEAARRLEEVNNELEAFSFSVSHDLRAPLRAMQGFAQALLEDYAERLDSIGQDYAHRIVAAASHMDTLIRDLLAYSRLTRAELRLKPVPLERVVRYALEQLEAEIQEKSAQVVVEGSLPEVVGHKTTLVQVVSNLLSNAVKFVVADVQPQIRIWAQTSQTNVRLWVEDNGIGIAPEHQERIFHVFERLHGIEAYPGTGIGLAVVRKGMERMGGRVGVESEAGRGSRFWVELPQVENKP